MHGLIYLQPIYFIVEYITKHKEKNEFVSPENKTGKLIYIYFVCIINSLKTKNIDSCQPCSNYSKTSWECLFTFKILPEIKLIRIYLKHTFNSAWKKWQLISYLLMKNPHKRTTCKCNKPPIAAMQLTKFSISLNCYNFKAEILLN